MTIEAAVLDPTPAEGPSEVPRPPVAAARRVVVKLGTRVLTQADGRLSIARLSATVEAVAERWAAGRETLLVTSGAVALGREALGLLGTPLELDERQACAAVGQARLMSLYQQAFSTCGRRSAQVLLNQGDFAERGRYLSLRAALGALLRRGVVPVINENDAVATDELAYFPPELQTAGERRVFGDNDRLSALVATKLEADLLVILTDVPGLYDHDPRKDKAAKLLPRVDAGEERLAEIGGAGSATSRGGMRTKVEAALVAVRGGCDAVIASGLDPTALPRVLAGEEVGTWFPRRGERLDARRRWIGFATAPRGVLHLDAGAVAAMRGGTSSLLAAGVMRLDGDFHRGDVVELRGPDGQPIGRGVVACDRATAEAWAKEKILADGRRPPCVVRREQMVLEESRQGSPER